ADGASGVRGGRRPRGLVGAAPEGLLRRLSLPARRDPERDVLRKRPGRRRPILTGYAMVERKAPRALQLLPLFLAAGVKATGGFAAIGVAAYAVLRERPPRDLPRAGSLALA